MRIGILSPKQVVGDTPYKHVPKRVVSILLNEAFPRIVTVSKSVYQELRPIPDSDYARLLHPNMKIIEKLLPPIQPSNLDLYYPNPRYFVRDCGILQDPLQS